MASGLIAGAKWRPRHSLKRTARQVDPERRKTSLDLPLAV